MKYLLLLSLLFTQAALAFDVCSYSTTWDMNDDLDAKGIVSSKTSEEEGRFTFNEKKMVHLTITLQNYLQGSSLEDALRIFAKNEGRIVYYNIEEKTFAFAQYFPGDNEYGAFYEVKAKGKGAFKLLAKVEDGDIFCYMY